MDRLVIPVFSGQGSALFDSRRVQDQALICSSSPAGTVLLSSCFQAFHSDLSSLSYVELEMTGVSLTDFDQPFTLLVIPPKKYARNPVVSGTRLLLIQVLIYLEWATRTVGEEPDGTFATLLERNRRHRVGIVGFSSGVISACVVGTSATLLDYLSNAASAFRVALWIGVRTQCYRIRTLAAPAFHANDDHSWSRILLGMGYHATEEAISRFCLQAGEPALLYVSAVNDEQCITVSGRPDVLGSFTATLPGTVSVFEASIGALYHSSMHNTCVREEVLADLSRLQIGFPTYDDIICPIRSAFTGEILDSNDNGSLVQSIVDMILIQQVNWDKVISGVAESIPENETAHFLNVGPGSGLMRSMERALRSGGLVTQNVIFDDTEKTTFLEPAQECIAIVGMAVNMPGAPNASKLWEILLEGVNTVTEVPESRFRVGDYTTGPLGRSMKAHTGNFLEHVDKFDHEFFNISPREARSMDPQMRILLHTAYEALEDSGYVPNASKSFDPATFGCYVGAATGDYVMNLRNNIDVYYSTGTLRAFLSGRISYAMGFGGPSVVVDTACSSSLVAIYQACRALLNGDCNAALAGGVNVITSPDTFIGLDRSHFLSPTGQCRVFDASADGYSRGEGCGLFVLKRFSDARAENDRILGIIRGAEVNQSGAAGSITQPHVPTQIKLFRRLLDSSGISPEDVNVVEAHGTGTQSGDVGELESIRRMFSAGRSAENPLHITSIKANIGHLEAASGAASLAKLLLMLQHRIIPRLISLVNLNPRISELTTDHTVIDTETRQWNGAKEGSPRTALLNNFGAAGSNCALLLQEYVPPASPKESAPSAVSYVFGLSAKTEVALVSMRLRVVDWLDSADAKNVPLGDIAYSLTARRQLYEYRVSVTARTRQELVEGLLSGPSSVRVSRKSGRAAFVFSGQGGQYIGMGSALYRSVPLFGSIIDHCHSFLVKSGFAGVMQYIAPDENRSILPEVEESEVYQSAIFALEYALCQLWMSWGVTPAIVVGHSLGEYVAQTVAGVLTLEDALLLVANRARLMVQKCAPTSTGMMAINLGAVAIGKILALSSEYSDITIACYNSPDDHVVSGPVLGLQALKSYLDGVVRCKSFLLPVGFGLHSRAMGPLEDELTLLAGRITITPPVIPIISNVYGKLVLPGDATVFDAQYYSRHCTEPVLFDQGIRGSVTTDSFPVIDAWIEIGPHATILPSLRRQTVIQKDALFLASMWKRQDPLASLHGALARLYVSPLAFEIKWRKVFSYLPFLSNLSLPTYPWSNASFWVGFKEETPPTYKTNPLPGPKAREQRLPYAVLHACIQSPFAGNGYSFVFETPMSHLSNLICGHRVREQPLCPASTYQELALAGVEASIQFLHHSAFKNRFVVLHDIDFQSPLVYSEGSCYAIQTSIVFETENAGSWKVITTNDGEKIHAHGGFQLQRPSNTISRFSVIHPIVSHRVAAITSRRDGKIFTTSSVYQVIFPRVVTYGKNYRAVRTLTISAEGTEGYATVQLPNNADRDGFVVHPILMDAMLHVAGFIANMCGGANANDAFICSKVGSVEVIPRLIDDSAPYGVYVNCAWLPGGDMLAESYTLEQDRIVAHFEGIHFRKVPLTTLEHGLTLAAGLEASSSSGLSFTPPAEVKSRSRSGSVLSKSRSRSGSVLLSPGVAVNGPLNSLCGANLSILSQTSHDIKAATVGNTLEMPRIKPDVSLPSSSTLVEEFSDDGDDTCQSDVKALLAAVLGLEVEELREDVDLELLGLDSLASIEAHHALQSHFAMLLPSDLFTTHTSANAVESFITSRLLLASCETDSDSADTARLTADPIADCPETLPVPVQRTRLPGRVPLLLIHDGSGLVSYIRNLPSLGRDLWGIYNPYFIDGRPWESVVSMAAEYAKYATEAGLGPVLLGGWSFGGIVAFEVARHLLKADVAVKGVVLIDSPSPLDHVPLSDALIESAVKLDNNNRGSGSVPSGIGLLVKEQFRMNSRMLRGYDPAIGGGPYPQLVLLCSCENYDPGGGLEVPGWLSDRGDRRSAAAGWESVVGKPVKCIDIPGHHFQVFHSLYISTTASAIMEACSFLDDTADR